MDHAVDKKFIQERMLEYALNSDKSMAEISKKMGKEDGYISSATKGRFEPKLSEVLVFCDILGITPAQFFEEDRMTLEMQQVCTKMRLLSETQVKLLQNMADQMVQLNLLRES